MANHHSHGSSNNSSNISGVGAFIPREVLDPKPSREERQRVLESKQDTLETKFNALVDELSKYRQVAVDLANKNAIIDELKDRVDTLEELLVKKANVAIGNAELKALSEERRVTKNLEERLFKMETEVDGIKVDLGEVMFVYDDVQDRLYDIDRTWKNNLIFNGIRVDPHGVHESPDCLENKIRQVLKNKLNIGREIVIMRCQRVMNGVDKFGNKPIVVNFQKWSDKEEILRKSKILKNSGILIEEDFSRAAKVRRRELEKLVKEVKAVDQDRKCIFKYDKLIIDDEIFVYNEMERRIERLPFNLSGQQASQILGGPNISSRDDDVQFNEDPALVAAVKASAAARPRLGLSKSARPWRAKSVESIISKIPEVTSCTLGTGGGGGLGVGGPRHGVLGSSSPSLVAKEKAKAAAVEKMTPNFDLDKADDERDEEVHEVELVNCTHVDDSGSDIGAEEPKFRPDSTMTASTKATKGSKEQSSEEEDDEFLPLNNVVDWEEWNSTGSYFPPRKRSAKANGKAKAPGRTSPKLKAKVNGLGNGRKQQQQQQRNGKLSKTHK